MQLECTGINAAFIGFFPDLADDSYATINFDGPASSAGLQARLTPPGGGCSALRSNHQRLLHRGWYRLNVNTFTGGSWYVLNTAANALA